MDDVGARMSSGLIAVAVSRLSSQLVLILASAIREATRQRGDQLSGDAATVMANPIKTALRIRANACGRTFGFDKSGPLLACGSRGNGTGFPCQVVCVAEAGAHSLSDERRVR